ncbi:hypothetical protein [Myxosarcina sp. GI1]|uniref:hypothetical protein n=1 Tax=Myxosarcina sp. GI1 TaxID=1541065 RepID=UPI00056B5653|nr:hypothetical protein [Myxosarcina sp. GI1]
MVGVDTFTLIGGISGGINLRLNADDETVDVLIQSNLVSPEPRYQYRTQERDRSKSKECNPNTEDK